MSKVLTFFSDGGTRNNGDFGNQQSYICGTTEDGGMMFLEDVGDRTSNEAELLAILKILKLASVKHKIIVKSDSQLAVNLINRKWLTEIDRLRKLLQEIWGIEKRYEIIWIEREQNLAGHKLEELYGL